MRKPSATRRLKHWLQDDGQGEPRYGDVIDRVPRMELPRDRTDRRRRSVRFHLFLPKHKVYVVACAYHQGDGSGQDVLFRQKQVVEHARHAGIGCLYVDGDLLQSLERGSQEACDSFAKLVAGESDRMHRTLRGQALASRRQRQRAKRRAPRVQPARQAVAARLPA